MSQIDDLIERIRDLEEQVQTEYDTRRADFTTVVDQKRVKFSEQVAALQRVSKVGLWRYMTGAPFSSWVVAP